MRRGWHRRAGVAIYAVASAQLGHLIAYAAKLGPPTAGAAQSHGAHSYFPTAAGLGGAVLGAALLCSLLVVGAARVIAGRRRRLRIERGWGWFDAVAVLFALQLGIFAAQETLEALIAGAPVTPGPELLLWGAIGQLPVAALGGLALAWLSGRVVRALRELRYGVRQELRIRPPASAPALPRPALGFQPLAVAAPAVFIKRGPPPRFFR